MTDSTMDMAEFKASFEAGGVSGVTIQAVGDGFAIIIKTRKGSGPLVGIRERRPRIYKSLNLAAGFLHETGLRQNISLDLTNWEPGQKALKD